MHQNSREFIFTYIDKLSEYKRDAHCEGDYKRLHAQAHTKI